MKPNIKILKPNEIVYIKDRYRFQLMDDKVVVISKGGIIKTEHDKKKGFMLNTKCRRITFTPEAIAMWERDTLRKLNLVDVQNIINTLYVTYQEVNENNILTYYNNKVNNIIIINKEI